MRRKVPTGKGGNLEPTKENLARLRQQGKSNVEIAAMMGKSTPYINMLFSKHKIAPRNRSVPREKVEEMARLKKAGKSMRRIAEETGCSVSSVRNYLIQEGLLDAAAGKEETECFDLPETLAMAEPVEPKIHKVRYRVRRRGRRCLAPYLDITECMPH